MCLCVYCCFCNFAPCYCLSACHCLHSSCLCTLLLLVHLLLLSHLAPCCCLHTSHITTTFVFIATFIASCLVVAFMPYYLCALCLALPFQVRILLPLLVAPYLLLHCLVVAFAHCCLVPYVLLSTPSQKNYASGGIWSLNEQTSSSQTKVRFFYFTCFEIF